MLGGGVRDERAVAATVTASTQISLVRRAFLPSPLETRPGPAQIDAFARLRGWFTLSAIVVDIAIYFGFRGSPRFDADALRGFAITNIPLLLISCVLCFFVLRKPRRLHLPLSYLCVAIETFTSLTWIQLTGSVSSYFLIVIPVLILAYRLYAGYRLGISVYLFGAVLHAVMVALEELHVLEPASLFISDPGAIYREPLFRAAAASSIQLMFLAIFVLANLVSRALREKENQLDVVQRNLDRVVADVQPGRLSGQTLDGKYRVNELLGRGGMGEVYQAARLADGRDVAVKVLYAHLGTPDLLERFRREAAIASKLPATNVAQVLDVGHARDGGHHYLVMELLQGEDLGMLLRRRGRLPAEELLPIIDQLVGVIEAAHASGIVHRDLKPQNIFLVASEGGAPLVKLLDFGVARLVEGSELTQSAMLIGSPGYLAPEQVATEFGEVGPRADVFALGAITYRALTGQSAFPARNAAAAVYEAVHRDPDRPSKLDASLHADLDAFMVLALAKQPAKRYASATELARDLRAACAGTLDEATRARARDSDRKRDSSPAMAPTLAESLAP
ncbi:MAG TPA: serine/threonine-protein kinase [Kofleriaceae bacterium]|nr:serine/threonine-protein kinase [Kofleriaceae bacterium]